ncbi:Os02g0747300 [Oryza sativa Japonica Group]|uniref:Os02g0747300 protein n=2 Tax=Oryza sativa subsp. japonica TaxID=39947 RepID=A0A0N7KG35_ORYSJ|nr:Os02g0747300 [Oryza sativa Japonica Group]
MLSMVDSASTTDSTTLPRRFGSDIFGVMTTTAIGRGMTAAATTSRRLFHTRRGSRHLSPTLTCGSVINDKGRDRSGGLSSSVQILPPLRPRCTRIRRWQRQERRILRPLLLPCRSRHLSTPTHSNLPPAVIGEVDPTTSQYNDNIGRPRREGGMMMWRVTTTVDFGQQGFRRWG